MGAAGCCPDWKSGLVGLRAVTVKTPHNKADKDSHGQPLAGPNLEPFEPSTLHKYSGGMRETRFEYFHEEEEAPLVSPPAFGHPQRGYNTLSQPGAGSSGESLRSGSGAPRAQGGPFSHAEGYGRDRALEGGTLGSIRDIGRERAERD